MDDRITIFAFMAFVLLLAVAMVGAAMALRYKKRELQHRERLAALEKGAVLPALNGGVGEAPWTPRTFLLRGLIWLFLGLALAVFLLGMTVSMQHRASAADRVYEASFARKQGATEDQVREIMNDKREQGPTPALALIGLIPIGIGLAYLIAWRAEGAAARLTKN